MKPQDIIKAIAELDDDKPMIVQDHVGNISLDYFVEGERFMRRKGNYLLSRDAIVPVIEKHTKKESVSNDFFDSLGKVIARVKPRKSLYIEQREMQFATPSQLCEALLRATGKWIE